jgi:hypothetical protein
MIEPFVIRFDDGKQHAVVTGIGVVDITVGVEMGVAQQRPRRVGAASHGAGVQFEAEFAGVIGTVTAEQLGRFFQARFFGRVGNGATNGRKALTIRRGDTGIDVDPADLTEGNRGAERAVSPFAAPAIEQVLQGDAVECLGEFAVADTADGDNGNALAKILLIHVDRWCRRQHTLDRPLDPGLKNGGGADMRHGSRDILFLEQKLAVEFFNRPDPYCLKRGGCNTVRRGRHDRTGRLRATDCRQQNAGGEDGEAGDQAGRIITKNC